MKWFTEKTKWLRLTTIVLLDLLVLVVIGSAITPFLHHNTIFALCLAYLIIVLLVIVASIYLCKTKSIQWLQSAEVLKRSIVILWCVAAIGVVVVPLTIWIIDSYQNYQFEKQKQETLEKKSHDFTEEVIEFLQNFAEVERDVDKDSLVSLMAIEYFLDDNEGDWYKQNVNHVAEVTQKIIAHLKDNDKLSALNLLNSELNNFYAHPNADTESTYNLSVTVDYLMTECYGAASDTTITKEIELYEYCLWYADMVQFLWDDYTDVFIMSVGILHDLYEKKDDKEKLAIINDIMEYIETHEEKEAVLLSKRLMEID